MDEATEISPGEKNTSTSTGNVRNPFATDTVIDDSQESLHENDSKKIGCFFVEINDLAEDLRYKPLDFEDESDKHSQILKNREFNCTCQIQEKGLMIMSAGGTSFHLPLEQEVQAVHPMMEGLIIQFSLRKERTSMRSGIHSRYGMPPDDMGSSSQQQQQLCSYVTINKHPLSQLKVLGCLKRSDESILGWLESYEKIVYVSKDLPILVSYNSMLNRHAIHVIRANIDDSAKDNTQLNLNNTFYTLPQFNELSNSNIQSSSILTEILFEESIRVREMVKCQILRSGSSSSEFLVGMLIIDPTCYLKVYSLSFLPNSTMNIQLNTLKHFAIIHDVIDFYPTSLFASSVVVPQLAHHANRKRTSDQFNQLKTLQANIRKLQPAILTLHQNGSFQLQNGFMKTLLKFDIQIPSAIPGSFRQIKAISHFKNGRAQLHFSDGQKVHMKVAPQIQNPLVIIILKTLSQILDPELYHKMVSDVFRNCLDLSGFALPEQKGAQSSSSNTSSQTAQQPKPRVDEFDNFLCYLVYLLKLCSKSLNAIPNDGSCCEEGTSKKVKQQQSQSQLLLAEYLENPSITSKTNLNNSTNNSSNPSSSSSNWNRLLMSNYHQTQQFGLFTNTSPAFALNSANSTNKTTTNQPSTNQTTSSQSSSVPSSGHQRRSSELANNNSILSYPQQNATTHSMVIESSSSQSQNFQPSQQSILNNSSLSSTSSSNPKSQIPSSIASSIHWRVEINLQRFSECRLQILRALNLLYQDMKLSSSNSHHCQQLAYLLYCYAKHANFQYSLSYQDYYVRQHPTILLTYQTHLSLHLLHTQFHSNQSNKQQQQQQSSSLGAQQQQQQQQQSYQQSASTSSSPFNQNPGNNMNNSFNNTNNPIHNNILNMKADDSDYVEKEVPDVFRWVEYLMRAANETWKLEWSMPVLFRNTQHLCRILQIIHQGTQQQQAYSQPNSLIQGNNTSQSQQQQQQQQQYFYLSDLLPQSTQNTQQHQPLSQTYPLFSQYIFYTQHLQQFSSQADTALRGLQTTFSQHYHVLVFLYFLKKHITLEFIESLSFGLRAPIYEALRLLKLDFPPQLYEVTTPEGFNLVKREDILANRQQKIKKLLELPCFLSKVDFSSTINNLIRGAKNSQDDEQLYDSHLRKLNNNLIFEEVTRLLDTTKDIQIKQKYVEEISEEAFDVESQNILKKFATRRFSCLVGQGAFNFGSWSTYMTEVVKIPKINSTAVMPNEIKVTLDLKDEKDANLSQWPEFHNGAAASLKLSKSVMNMNAENLKTWIFYQKPENVEFEHGGFLLGLGLLGYLDCLSPTDIFQYLKPNHEATSVGILLGIAASRIGKSDDSTSKTLCLHIPFLLPPSYDVEIPLNVQTTALIGVGLIHKGSSNRLITEMTLAQIGRKPLSDKCLDREGYSLAAGFSLGLINLGKGASHTNIKDLELEARLIRFIEGGKIMDPPQSMLSTNFSSETKSSSIKEGNTVNTHVTAPGALIALSLLFLKSNDQKVAEKITIPNSFSTIECCNPNNILLKVLARNLIMWDSITNTSEFIYNQIPELISFIYEKPFKDVYQRYYLVYNVEEIDFSTVTSVYCNIIGGCVLAMGLKYAGTGDTKASEVIKNEISKMRKLKTSKCDLVNDPLAKSLIDQYSLFVLYSVSILALSLVNAGTCDTHSIKIARLIRKKFQDSGTFHYGFNMAINMAIGFLTLGHGNYSFSRNDMSIAALLISVYPYFPNSPSDNKYHLQPLRHFYVLALEQQVFHAVDVADKKVVNVMVELKYSVNDTLSIEKSFTPILLQESKKIISVKVIDEEYYGSQIDFSKESKNPKIIYVKRRYSIQKIINQQVLSDKDNFEEKKALSLYLKEIPFGKAFKDLEMNMNNWKISKNDLEFILPFRVKASSSSSMNNMSGLTRHLEILDGIFKPMQDMLFETQQDKKMAISEAILNSVQEDRLELLQSAIHLLKTNEGFLESDTIYLQNIKLLIAFYTQYSTKHASESLFNSDTLRIRNTQIQQFFVNSILADKQNPKTSDLVQAYFTQPDTFRLDRVELQDFPAMNRLLGLNTLCSVASREDLLLVKKFFDKLSLISGQQQQQGQSGVQPQQQQSEEVRDKLLSICSMYLYLSFPLTPQLLLNILTSFYLPNTQPQQNQQQLSMNPTLNQTSQGAR